MNRIIEHVVSFFHLRGAWFHLTHDTNLFTFKYKYRYAQTLRRLRQKVKDGEAINVLFLVDNISKWKCQSLYDELKKHKFFAPTIALSPINNKVYDTAMLEHDRKYYEAHGCKCVNAFDTNNGQLISLSRYDADIVFFQEPLWYDCHASEPNDLHTVSYISKYALCMYMPYSLEWGVGSTIHHQIHFHRKMFAQFAWNEEQAKYGRKLSPGFERSGKILGLGHTFLDQLQPDSKIENKGYVIYAPHFSFPVKGKKRPLTIGTFLWSGVPILEYAKKHPEIKWVFKPHPRLKEELYQAYSGWTKQAVDKYFHDWEKISVSCYDADYPMLFKQSDAMITDCGSFLLEYAVTGKPIIHLLPKELDFFPRASVKPLFDTYYEAHNATEMLMLLTQVIGNHEDAKKEARLMMLEKMNLIGNNAATKIVDYLKILVGL